MQPQHFPDKSAADLPTENGKLIFSFSHDNHWYWGCQTESFGEAPYDPPLAISFWTPWEGA